MRTRSFSLELTTPLGTANGPIDRREGVAVAVDPATDDVPAVGVGEATPLPGWTESLSACESALEGVTPLGSDESLDDALSALDPRRTPAARHGLALALADADARHAGRSLAARLADAHGLPTPDATVPVNATIGDADPDETAREAERAVARGFDCLKVKVGVRALEADVERLRAVRHAVGPEVDIRADANGAWDRETARVALDRLAPLDLAYVEQPLPADDLDGVAACRAAAGDGGDDGDGEDDGHGGDDGDGGEDGHGGDDGDGGGNGRGVPIALDESLASHDSDRVLAALDAAAGDAVVLKPMALGGPDRALSAAMRAREAGIEPVVTTTIDAVVARTAAVHVAAAIPDVAPCGLATGSLLAEDLAADPCPVSDGSVTVPTGNGLAGDAFEGLR